MRRISLNQPTGLYGKLFSRLLELEKEVKGIPKKGFIPYSCVREKLGRNFSIKKSEIMELIFFLRDVGFLETSQVGIKLHFVIRNCNKIK